MFRPCLEPVRFLWKTKPSQKRTPSKHLLNSAPLGYGHIGLNTKGNLLMAYPNTIAPPRHEPERFLRFALVGGVGTFVDFGLLFLFHEVIGLPLLAANSLSYLAGVANNFTLNRLWTYPDAQHRAIWEQFAKFLAVSTVGLVLNNWLVLLLAEPLGALPNLSQTGYLAAKVLATAVVFVWNFSANRFWTFNPAHTSEK